MAIERPHFEFPFRRVGGKVAVVEQDTVEHVHSCQNVIVRCPLGFRDDRPEFGWPFPEFVNVPVDTRALEQALNEFEPRANARAVEWADEADFAVRNISINAEVEI